MKSIKEIKDKTKNIKSREFEEGGVKYRIVDTVGISDTKTSYDEVLEKLAESCWYIKEKVNQVFFVTSGRFTDEKIINYTTIVRTNFPHFENKVECEQDTKKMIDNGGELAEIIHSCKGRIIHVDNPPTNISGTPTAEDRNKLNEKIRKESRKILLEHLKGCSEIYESNNFYRKNRENLKIFIEKREEILKELDEIKDKWNKKEKLDEGVKFLGPAVELSSGTVGTGKYFSRADVSDMLAIDSGMNIARGIANAVSLSSGIHIKNIERELLKKFREKIKEDENNKKEYSIDYDISPYINHYFLQMDDIRLNIEELKEGLEELKKEKTRYEEVINNWENRKEKLRDKIEAYHKKGQLESIGAGLNKLGIQEENSTQAQIEQLPYGVPGSSKK